ncbi:hypothetical protein JOC93_003894 [Priestia taiwanensis]|nr:hypothetical protein [Priestia taiwanensis]
MKNIVNIIIGLVEVVVEGTQVAEELGMDAVN